MQVLNWLSTEPQGQTAVQLAELTLALVLSSLIGLEREFRMKSAGLRTHTLVGVAAALLMLVSKYGFGDVLVAYKIVLDPSRVAAQIVSGIGFIGGGLIFVQRDIVRGLTTAATVWLTAAVGMACGAGLPVLALFVTAAHFLVMYGFMQIAQRVLSQQTELVVQYRAGKGAVREIMKLCTGRAFSVQEVTVPKGADPGDTQQHAIQLRLHGRGDVQSLAVAIADLQDVTAVQMSAAEDSKA
ncbi:MAG: MgtC/SapB family protein [Candidatus Dormibacteria bacterium]